MDEFLNDDQNPPPVPAEGEAEIRADPFLDGEETADADAPPAPTENGNNVEGFESDAVVVGEADAAAAAAAAAGADGQENGLSDAMNNYLGSAANR